MVGDQTFGSIAKCGSGAKTQHSSLEEWFGRQMVSAVARLADRAPKEQSSSGGLKSRSSTRRSSLLAVPARKQEGRLLGALFDRGRALQPEASLPPGFPAASDLHRLRLKGGTDSAPPVESLGQLKRRPPLAVEGSCTAGREEDRRGHSQPAHVGAARAG